MPWLAIAGAAFSIIGGSKAKRRAERQAAEEARLEGLVTQEKLRQMSVEQEIEQGSVRAQFAAAGADVNVGSPLNVMANQAAEFERLRRGVAEVGATRAANAQLRGKLQGEGIMWNSIGNALNTLGGANWG